MSSPSYCAAKAQYSARFSQRTKDLFMRASQIASQYIQHSSSSRKPSNELVLTSKYYNPLVQVQRNVNQLKSYEKIVKNQSDCAINESDLINCPEKYVYMVPSLNNLTYEDLSTQQYLSTEPKHENGGLTTSAVPFTATTEYSDYDEPTKSENQDEKEDGSSLLLEFLNMRFENIYDQLTQLESSMNQKLDGLDLTNLTQNLQLLIKDLVSKSMDDFINKNDSLKMNKEQISKNFQTESKTLLQLRPESELESTKEPELCSDNFTPFSVDVLTQQHLRNIESLYLNKKAAIIKPFKCFRNVPRKVLPPVYY